MKVVGVVVIVIIIISVVFVGSKGISTERQAKKVGREYGAGCA